MVVLFFFFSSRRRHTRSLCDWSSDVCSSDLGAMNCIGTIAGFHEALNQFQRAAIVPMQFIAPVPRLFLEERLNLAYGGLSQVDDVHSRADLVSPRHDASIIADSRKTGWKVLRAGDTKCDTTLTAAAARRRDRKSVV